MNEWMYVKGNIPIAHFQKIISYMGGFLRSFPYRFSSIIYIFLLLKNILWVEWCFDSFEVLKNWLCFDFCPGSWLGKIQNRAFFGIKTSSVQEKFL